MNDVALLTLAQSSAAIAEGRLTPLDLTNAYLARIERFNPQLFAFIRVCADEARRAARIATEEIAANGPRSPLHGIPFAIKDIIETKGITTTGQSALFADRVPDSSAFLWQSLEEAGAILLGKTTTWEFAIGGPALDLPWPRARNPWHAERDTGGSSSGSAAAVAAGLCAAAIGTDTGGSVRVPAAWCGCAGLKPTYGLVSRAGVYPLSFTLDHVGPICWTVEDCALVMDAIAKRDPRDRTTSLAPDLRFADNVKDGVKGIRIGRVRNFSADIELEPAVADGLERAIAGLKAAGAEIVDVDLPDLAAFDATCNLISRAESFAFHRTALQQSPEKFGAEARARLMAGGTVAAADYIGALRNRTALIEDVEAVFSDVDVLVCELSGSTAPNEGGSANYGRLATRPFNVTGSPALSICTGFDASGLPTAVQIVGRAYEDPLVLRAGYVVEQAVDFRAKRAMPPLSDAPERMTA
ncbi:amidase [Consotaella aegiceratis]|uniref:amidase n=1 Tax=Consotaella aegiceratis TaxID=3097961 RepID=UPI002F3FA814